MKYDIKIFRVLIFLLITHTFNYQILPNILDSRGYLELFLSILVLIVFYKKHKLKSFITVPIIIWGILMTFHVINGSLKNPNIFEEYNIVVQTGYILCLMIFVPYIYTKNKLLTLKTLVYSYLYLLFGGYILGEFSDSGRLTGFIYTTQLGQLAGVSCISIAIYSFLKQKIKYILLLLFPIYVMFMSGARNGLLVVFFAFICLFIPYFKKHIKYLFIVLVFLTIFSHYLIESSLLQRFSETEETILIETNTILDKILGERAFHYIGGFQNFLNNPITGIGLFNFAPFNDYKYILHSEPMVHLTEGGIIAFSLYLWFKIYIYKNIAKYLTVDNLLIIQYLVIFLCLTFLGLTARIFHVVFFFPLYGLMIGEYLYLKKLKRK